MQQYIHLIYSNDLLLFFLLHPWFDKKYPNFPLRLTLIYWKIVFIVVYGICVVRRIENLESDIVKVNFLNVSFELLNVDVDSSNVGF